MFLFSSEGHLSVQNQMFVNSLTGQSYQETFHVAKIFHLLENNACTADLAKNLSFLTFHLLYSRFQLFHSTSAAIWCRSYRKYTCSRSKYFYCLLIYLHAFVFFLLKSQLPFRDSSKKSQLVRQMAPFNIVFTKFPVIIWINIKIFQKRMVRT